MLCNQFKLSSINCKGNQLILKTTVGFDFFRRQYELRYDEWSLTNSNCASARLIIRIALGKNANHIRQAFLKLCKGRSGVSISYRNARDAVSGAGVTCSGMPVTITISVREAAATVQLKPSTVTCLFPLSPAVAVAPNQMPSGLNNPIPWPAFMTVQWPFNPTWRKFFWQGTKGLVATIFRRKSAFSLTSSRSTHPLNLMTIPGTPASMAALMLPGLITQAKLSPIMAKRAPPPPGQYDKHREPSFTRSRGSGNALIRD